MLTNTDITAIVYTAVSTAGLGGIAYFGKGVANVTKGVVSILEHANTVKTFIQEHNLIDKVKRAWKVIMQLEQHFENNAPAVQAARNLEQAATIEPGPDAADLRRAKIAEALNLLPQAAGVEFAKLKEPAVAPVIAKMLNDHLPELGGSITPDEVTGLLNAGEAGLGALRNHDLLRTVLQVLACVEPQTAQSVVSTTSEAPISA